MLTRTQKEAAQAIVRVFETGSVRGNYAEVTLIPGDSGHLSFGVFQATLGAGNLSGLLAEYHQRPGARFGPRMAPYLPRLAATDLSLDGDEHLKNLLRASADDPVMRDTQDAFFERVYWQPAERAAAQMGIATPLGHAVLFDGRVHGSLATLAARTTEDVGAPAQAGEQPWLRAYVARRRAWLAKHKRLDLRPTVYRMEAFARLMDQGHWNLELPFVVRGLEISGPALAQLPPHCYSGPPPGSRTLFLETPLMRGEDVRLVQLALSERGVPILADGIFGPTSRNLVSAFQARENLPATGAVDAVLFPRLGLA